MIVVGWNSAAEELLGYSTTEALGKKCGQVLQAFFPTGEPLCSMMCEGRSCIISGKKWSIGNCRIRHKAGQMISAGISTLVLPAEARGENNGDAVAMVFLRKPGGTALEITDIQPLRIFTLGHFELTLAGKGLNVESWKRKQAAVVLKCLTSHLGRPVHRERLIDWLWPDASPERGWERLKVTISFLRSKLRSAGALENTIETVGQSYLLHRDAVWVDSDALGSLVKAGWNSLKDNNIDDALSRFEEAESLYHGDYLEDELFADWCAVERERLREVYLELLTGLIKCNAKKGLFVEAAQVCQKALLCDPCRESFLRALLENLANLGQLDWAASLFRSWRRRLEEEYGLQPTHETIRTYQQLVGEYVKIPSE